MSGKELRTERFTTGFKTYDNSKLLSNVSLECKNYDTFTELVEAIQDILRYETKEAKLPVKLKRGDLTRTHDDILDMIKDIPYPVYSPGLIAPFDLAYNPYHRHCRQLEVKLKKHGVKCNVSRSNVGEHSYYNLSFKLDKTNENCSDWRIKKILGIENVGLVEYNRVGDTTYMIILVDEDELNDKYLVDGDLVF